MSGIHDALRTLHPDRVATSLFKAGLNSEPSASRSVEELISLADGDLVQYLSEKGEALRGHLSLLQANLASLGVTPPASISPYIKTALVREKLRQDIFEGCLRDALERLQETEVPWVAVKGVAAANLAYAKPYLRHCHDFDLVVTPDGQTALSEHFKAAGYYPVAQAGTSMRFDHPTGMPVMLHREPVTGLPTLTAEEMLSARAPLATPIGEIWVPAPERAVLHCCLHGVGPDRRPQGNWVPDAVLMLRRFTEADANTFRELVTHPDYAFEMRAAIAYLNEHYDALPDIEPPMWPEAVRNGQPEKHQLRHYAKLSETGYPKRYRAFLGQLTPEQRAYCIWIKLFPPAEDLGLTRDDRKTKLWSMRAKRLMMIAWWRVIKPVLVRAGLRPSP